jgi:hypothetical protein
MTSKAEQTFRSLPEFIRGSAFLTLVVGADDGEAHRLQRVNISNDVAEQFRDVFVTELSRADEYQVRRYEPGYKAERDEVQYVSSGDDSVAELLGNFSGVNHLELFSESDDVVENLKFNAVVATDREGETAIGFRIFRPGQQELTRSKWMALVRSEGSYTEVGTKVFLFDRQFDCIAFGSFVYILNVANFQRIFSYFEQLRERGRELAESVCSVVPVSNASKFVDACERHLAMISKLAIVVQKPYFASLTISDIEKVIKHHELDIEIVKSGGKRHLVFDPRPGRRWDILKVLDDDYLTSVMTNADYEVNSKRPRGDA